MTYDEAFLFAEDALLAKAAACDDMGAHGYAERIREAVVVLKGGSSYLTIPSELFERKMTDRGYRVEFEDAARQGMLGKYDGALE